MPAPLPLAPRPYAGEAISSWVKRVAARYDIAAHHLVSHVLDGTVTSARTATRSSADASVEAALGTEPGFDLARIESLRIAGDDGSASCWHRMCPAWCPVCIRGDLAHLGEVYERAIWRLGCCVLCPRHGCHSMTRAGIARRRRHVTSVASTGFFDWPAIRAAGTVDPTLCRNGGLDDEGASVTLVFSSPPVSPSGSGISRAMRLRHSAGRFPERSWGLVPAASHLIDAIRELAACISWPQEQNSFRGLNCLSHNPGRRFRLFMSRSHWPRCRCTQLRRAWHRRRHARELGARKQITSSVAIRSGRPDHDCNVVRGDAFC